MGSWHEDLEGCGGLETEKVSRTDRQSASYGGRGDRGRLRGRERNPGAGRAVCSRTSKRFLDTRSTAAGLARALPDPQGSPRKWVHFTVDELKPNVADF